MKSKTDFGNSLNQCLNTEKCSGFTHRNSRSEVLSQKGIFFESSQKNTYIRASFLVKLMAVGHGCRPSEFCEILRTPVLKDICELLPLFMSSCALACKK